MIIETSIREAADRKQYAVTFGLNFQAIEMQTGNQKIAEGGLIIKQAAAVRAVMTGFPESSNQSPIRVNDISMAFPVVLV